MGMRLGESVLNYGGAGLALQGKAGVQVIFDGMFNDLPMESSLSRWETTAWMQEVGHQQ